MAAPALDHLDPPARTHLLLAAAAHGGEGDLLSSLLAEKAVLHEPGLVEPIVSRSAVGAHLLQRSARSRVLRLSDCSVLSPRRTRLHYLLLHDDGEQQLVQETVSWRRPQLAAEVWRRVLLLPPGTQPSPEPGAKTWRR